MSTDVDLEGLGTDELHTLMAAAIQGLPGVHPVRVLWDRMDQILTDCGPECLPAPWDDDAEPHAPCDAEAAQLNREVGRLRAAATAPVAAAIQSIHQRGAAIPLLWHCLSASPAVPRLRPWPSPVPCRGTTSRSSTSTAPGRSARPRTSAA